jgi:hypothetical protein
MRSFLRYSLLLLAVLAGLTMLLPRAYHVPYPAQVGPVFDNAVRSRYTNILEEYKVKVALMGDSVLEQSVDGEALSKSLNTPSYPIAVPGSTAPFWYLILKNIILEADPRPETVILLYRDTILTLPDFHTKGGYVNELDQFATAHEPVLVERAYLNFMNPLEKWAEAWFPPFGSRWSVRQAVDARIRYTLPAALLNCDTTCMNNGMELVFGELNMDPNFLSDALAAADTYLYSREALNFDRQVGESFLPDLIQMTRDHGVQLILVQMRILRFSVPGSEPPALHTYNQHLAAYLAANGVIYLDYSHETSLGRDYFSDPLHMNDAGKAVFTEMFGEDLLKYIH